MTKSINPSTLSQQTSHASLGIATQKVTTNGNEINSIADCIEQERIREIAGQHEAGDKRQRKLSCVTLLWLLVTGLATGGKELGLKFLADLYATQQTDQAKQQLSKAALSKQLRQRPWPYMKAMVEAAMQVYAELFIGSLGQTCAEWVRQILIVDETIMKLSLALFDHYPASRSTVERPRAAQKTAVCLHPASGLPDVLAIRAERDNRINSQFLRPVGEKALYLFDLGYWWYDLFDAILARGQHFVTRLRLDAAITVERVLQGDARWQGQCLKFNTPQLDWLTPFTCIDLIARLGSPSNCMQATLRLVGVFTPQHGWRFWVTSLQDAQVWTPTDIADLYRLRWQIEILFRVLKQVLNIHHFVTTNENGFRLQIYAALLLYVLTRILILKAAQQSGQSPEAFSETYALQVVSLALQRQSDLLRIGRQPNWEELEDNLVNLIIHQARRANPKRSSQLSKFLNRGAA